MILRLLLLPHNASLAPWASPPSIQRSIAWQTLTLTFALILALTLTLTLTLILTPTPTPTPTLGLTQAKHMIVIKDTTFSEMMAFLDEADRYGKAIPTTFTDGVMAGSGGLAEQTVATEARTIKRMLLQLMD